jgi:hypothetical protein
MFEVLVNGCRNGPRRRGFFPAEGGFSPAFTYPVPVTSGKTRFLLDLRVLSSAETRKPVARQCAVQDKAPRSLRRIFSQERIAEERRARGTFMCIEKGKYCWSDNTASWRSTHNLRKPCLFENAHGCRKVYGQFESSMGHYESL